MAIKMVTDTIPTGNGRTFEQIVQAKLAARNANVVKTAAKEEDQKECECGEWEAAHPNGKDMEEEKDCKAEGDTEVKAASGSNEDDTAPSSGQLDVEPLHQKGESEDAGNKDLCDDSVKKTEAAGIDNFGDKKAKPFGQKDDEGDKGEKEETDDDDDKEAAVKGKDLLLASTGGKYVKTAKLNDKTRSFLREYWRNLYPEDYVNAMLAD